VIGEISKAMKTTPIDANPPAAYRSFEDLEDLLEEHPEILPPSKHAPSLI